MSTLDAFTVQLFQDSAREWRWRVRAANGKVVADSAEGYKRRPDAEEMVKRLFPNFTTIVLPS